MKKITLSPCCWLSFWTIPFIHFFSVCCLWEDFLILPQKINSFLNNIFHYVFLMLTKLIEFFKKNHPACQINHLSYPLTNSQKALSQPVCWGFAASGLHSGGRNPITIYKGIRNSQREAFRLFSELRKCKWLNRIPSSDQDSFFPFLSAVR